MVMNWNDEATYIEQTVALEETPEAFNGIDAVLLRYCRMQLQRAQKAGAKDAAKRIKAAIESEWPGKSVA